MRVPLWFRAFLFSMLHTCLSCNVLLDCDGAADETPELSDDDADDEEQWQWMEEGDTERVSVPCLFCDRWDHDTVDFKRFRDSHSFVLPLFYNVFLHCYV